MNTAKALNLEGVETFGIFVTGISTVDGRNPAPPGI